jgi:hypothetical protein
MTPYATTTMTGLVNAIVATLRAHAWPAPIRQIGFRQPDLEPDDNDSIASRIETPALFLNITDRTQAGAEPGRVLRRCRFELHCLLSTATPNLPLELIEFSEAVMALIDARESLAAPNHGNRWGLFDAVDLPENLTDADAGYAIAWHGHAARVLSWDQTVYLAEALR